MTGDGNAWVLCACGHRHWGRFGAAGILLTDGRRVVLQRRALATHEGGTWAVPGGARDSHEDAVTTALREAAEETTLDPALVTPFDQWIDEHGDWSYTTVLASAPTTLVIAAGNWEADDVRWWDIEAVDTLGDRLHNGFRRAWPHLLAKIRVHHAAG